jgi:hypothetical protein
VRTLRVPARHHDADRHRRHERGGAARRLGADAARLPGRRELATVSYQNALRVPAGSYYQYEATIGLTGEPSASDTTLYILYARIPSPLNLDGVPEWGGEWNYLLRHYAAWRCMRAASGAQDLRWIVNERAFYDDGVAHLRAATNRSMKISPVVLRGW